MSLHRTRFVPTFIGRCKISVIKNERFFDVATSWRNNNITNITPRCGYKGCSLVRFTNILHLPMKVGTNLVRFRKHLLKSKRPLSILSIFFDLKT
jgi:hypothetical protein